MVEPKPLRGRPSPQPGRESSLGGLFDGFESYRTPAEADYHHVLTNGLVVPDTNVFLNLYRYNDRTRNDLLSLFRSLGDNLWVPNQVIVEFWRNREKVLQDARDTDKTVRELTQQREKTIATVRAWINRVKLPSDQGKFFTDIFEEAYESVVKGVSDLTDKNATEFARNTNKDPIVKQLEEILSDRVGKPLADSQYKEAATEAKRRAESKIPPGYRDIGKGDDGLTGDYLIWAQTLIEAQSQSKDILIVTGDVKEDWWRRERGEVRGPRPELAQELSNVANVRLFMLQPDSLLRYGQRILKLSISEKSVKDIERVDKYLANSADANLDAIRDYWPDIIESLKRIRRVAWMLVSKAKPVDLNGRILTIEFPQESDVQGFKSSGCDTNLEQAIFDITGMWVEINSVNASVATNRSGRWIEDPALSDE